MNVLVRVLPVCLVTSLLASNAAAQAFLVADVGTNAVGMQNQLGRVATFICPSTLKTVGNVWGSDVYDYESSICSAAIHAGVHSLGSTSQVTIRIGGPVDALVGAERNGVTSSAYARADATYSFVGNGELAQIDWTTSFERAPDGFSTALTLLCPANGHLYSSLIGTDVYRADSGICHAAAHAGLVTLASGGVVAVKLEPRKQPLTGSTRNGITSQSWSSSDYLSFPQPFSVAPGAVAVTVPTSTPAMSAGPQPLTAASVSPSVAIATAPQASPVGTRAIVTEDRPSNPQPTVLSNGPAPTGLTVTGTPTEATVQWLPVPGATGYLVNRALQGTTQWTAVTPERITDTVSPTDVLTDWLQVYTYQVVAYQADGTFGAATVDYVPAKPRDPTGLAVTAASADSAVISWQPVDNVWGYLVSGPGLSPSAETTNTSFVVVPPLPSRTGVYKVASIYRPGGVLTPESEWPSVTAMRSTPVSSFARPGTTAGSAAPSSGGTAASCACTRTGAFRRPTLQEIGDQDLRSQFTHPTAGTFTVEAQSVASSVFLTITDAQSRVVLSLERMTTWGWSPDNRYFAVAYPPSSRNTPSPITVYRVAAGPNTWPPIINTSVDADGQWGFSAGSKMFLITRLENSPTRFSFRAYNLEGQYPDSPLQVSEANVSGPSITTSPCDDRLMYFRWTQTRGPLMGRADFYDRASFGPRAAAIETSWDEESQTTPTASIVEGTDSVPFEVSLNGLVLGGGSQRTFPSLQCVP